MIDVGINGFVLRVKGASGDFCSLPLYGKTVEGWAADAIGAECAFIDASPVIDISDKLRAAADVNKPVTVVLYGDTPLVSRSTVAQAVADFTASNTDMKELPSGFIIKTRALFDLGQIFISDKPATGEFAPISSAEDYSRVSDIVRKRILRFHADNGVIIKDFSNTHIDCDVIIGSGAVIEPYNFIKGRTVIESNAVIMPGNYIENCFIGSGARVDSSRLYDSAIGADTRVGPFAYIRPECVIGKSCRIGDFVELKSCVLGDGCKVSHLTYIGDAQLGRECNVGCGVVFANYDGKNKYRSEVGDRVFIGSNANIVAPVRIESGAFIAAGSTVTADVPKHALAVARARQRVIPEWKGNLYAPVNTEGNGDNGQ